jgi:stress response protein YsnF
LEEVLVVEKRLLLKEELRITRDATTEVAELPVTVRKQRAVVERLSSEGETSLQASEQEP